MSYDLFFRAGTPGAVPRKDQFRQFFDGRLDYEVSETQAWYTNEDTGVYFVFEYNDEPEDLDVDGAERDETLLPMTFNPNYYRPHVFGLEAEPELRAFVEHFDLLVSDPQMRGMGDGPYSAEGFLQGWNDGNEFGYRAILSEHADTTTLLTLPTDVVERCWRWNLGRREFQEQVGEDIFVPKVVFLAEAGEVKTAAIWTDGIPIMLPEVDHLFFVREMLAPRKRFKRTQDFAVAPHQYAAALVASFPRKERFLPYHVLHYDETPSAIRSFIKRLKPAEPKPECLSVDQILNRELVAKHRAQ